MRLGPVPHDIERAAAILRRGGLVAFPTETVYGLGGIATSDLAVAKIFDAKERPRFNPLIVHVANVEAARSLAHWTDLAEQLSRRFWPGPLTLVLKRSVETSISRLVSAGGDTIAIRIPDQPAALSLLAATGLPVAGPSANPAGRISPTTSAHVIDGLGERIDAILEDGAAAVGVESTVVDISDGHPRLLRPGGLPRSSIEALISLDPGFDKNDREAVLRAPGQLTSHYAPRHPVRLDATDVRPDEALLAFGTTALQGAAVTRNLSVSGDLLEAAANLFAMLHELDKKEVSAIAVMMIPGHGLGEAIRDRLARAATERTMDRGSRL